MGTMIIPDLTLVRQQKNRLTERVRRLVYYPIAQTIGQKPSRRLPHYRIVTAKGWPSCSARCVINLKLPRWVPNVDWLTSTLT
jgi:hypothetical protein